MRGGHQVHGVNGACRDVVGVTIHRICRRADQVIRTDGNTKCIRELSHNLRVAGPMMENLESGLSFIR